MLNANFHTLVRSTLRQTFVSEYAGYYLLKRPKPGASMGRSPLGFGFETTATSNAVDPYAREWQVMPVVKRPDVPFPEQIALGRAPNCDIVLRIPAVSKVQMHILLMPNGSLSVRDSRASNPLVVNGKKLAPGESCPLKIGDSIQFASITLEFVDAARLYDILKAEAA